ncbi:MAG: hypothetical protein KDA86_03565 [Planctomycetaceae bacterium]|nr:hypothetical protein [Planctomycetaceae bacterium]
MPVSQTVSQPDDVTDEPLHAEATSNPASESKSAEASPFDVFFDDPLAVAAGDDSSESIETNPDNRTTDIVDTIASTMSDGSVEIPPESTDPSEITDSERAQPVADWRRLASVDVLNEEVKQLRNRLTANLKTVATYNRNLEAIVNDCVVLAGIAAVVAVHPEALSWKDHAAQVRDLAATISSEASGTGREPYSVVQTSFEQIITILNGGSPPNSESIETVPFADVADRSELMKRTKRSFDWLKSEINTKDRFDGNQDEIVREATVLVVFGGLISTDSYDSADEPHYQEFVREFVEANLAINSAVQAGSYEEFTIARDRVQNACAACHGEYAFGDEGL